METPVKKSLDFTNGINQAAPNFEVQMASNNKLKEKMNSVGSTPVLGAPQIASILNTPENVYQEQNHEILSGSSMNMFASLTKENQELQNELSNIKELSQEVDTQ